MALRVVHGVLAVALLASLTVAGCGRRGALEPPPNQAITTNEEGKTVDPGIVRPDRPFVLDPLLN